MLNYNPGRFRCKSTVLLLADVHWEQVDPVVADLLAQDNERQDLQYRNKHENSQSNSQREGMQVAANIHILSLCCRSGSLTPGLPISECSLGVFLQIEACRFFFFFLGGGGGGKGLLGLHRTDLEKQLCNTPILPLSPLQ